MDKIIIDTFGADSGDITVIKGVAKALKKNSGFLPILVGNKETAQSILDEEGISQDAYEVIHTERFITNSDLPTAIFGGNDDTSMAISYDRLKNDSEAVAMLSAGNTGALLVGSICRLGLISGLKFPVLSSALPYKENLIVLADCGANTECTPKDLARFALLGNAFSASYCGTQNPRVALLSVGREDTKGTSLTKEAFNLIKELPLNFIGNAEGSDLLNGYADVIVADGFSGNLLLKNAEAIGKRAIELLDELQDNSGILDVAKDKLFKAFDFNSQGGATFLGTKKIVVKAHGEANEDTVAACIEQILRLKSSDFVKRISELNLK